MCIQFELNGARVADERKPSFAVVVTVDGGAARTFAESRRSPHGLGSGEGVVEAATRNLEHPAEHRDGLFLGDERVPHALFLAKYVRPDTGIRLDQLSCLNVVR